MSYTFSMQFEHLTRDSFLFRLNRFDPRVVTHSALEQLVDDIKQQIARGCIEIRFANSNFLMNDDQAMLVAEQVESILERHPG